MTSGHAKSARRVSAPTAANSVKTVPDRSAANVRRAANAAANTAAIDACNHVPTAMLQPVAVASKTTKGVQTVIKTKRKMQKLMTEQPISSCLRFTPSTWAKLLFLRDCGDTEVGGFGIAPIDDLLLVEDIQLVHQRTSWAHVEFDDESVADHFDRNVEAGRQPEQFARIWIHTHPGDCPEPSLTDEETFCRVFGRSEWAMMFILARGGDTYARLRFNVGPGGEVLVPATVDFSTTFSASETDEWEQEYAANVFAETTARSIRTASIIRNHSDPEDSFEDFELSDGWQEYMEQEMAFAGELL
jgi:proteasome lid subunit RPN8/RPN11